jgi:hypothetical protein
MRAGREDDIGRAQPDKFGHAEPGVECDDQEGRVATPDPRRAIGHGEQRFNLRPGEESDQSPVRRLLRNGQNALDLIEVIG